MKFTWSSSYIVSAELGVLQSHSPVWLSRLLRASLFQTSSWTWTCYLRTCIHVWQNWGSDSSSEGPNRRKGLSVPTPLFNPWVHQLETQLDFKTAFIQHSSFCTAFVHKLWRNGICRCCDPVGTLTINMGGLKNNFTAKTSESGAFVQMHRKATQQDCMVDLLRQQTRKLEQTGALLQQQRNAKWCRRRYFSSPLSSAATAAASECWNRWRRQE